MEIDRFIYIEREGRKIMTETQGKEVKREGGRMEKEGERKKEKEGKRKRERWQWWRNHRKAHGYIKTVS